MAKRDHKSGAYKSDYVEDDLYRLVGLTAPVARPFVCTEIRTWSVRQWIVLFCVHPTESCLRYSSLIRTQQRASNACVSAKTSKCMN